MKIIAHRGASRELPENTLAAFERALEIGVDAIETDLLLTKDRRIVVRHDDFVRHGSRWRFIKDMTLAELRAVDLCGERIPVFEEFMERFSEECALFLDLKSYGIAGPLARALKKLKKTGQIHITSFLTEEVQQMAKLLPDAERSLAFTALPPGWEAALKSCGAKALSVYRGYLKREQADLLRKKKIKLRIYPVNIPEEAKRFKLWGADGIFTDDPRAMKGLRA